MICQMTNTFKKEQTHLTLSSILHPVGHFFTPQHINHGALQVLVCIWPLLPTYHMVPFTFYLPHSPLYLPITQSLLPTYPSTFYLPTTWSLYFLPTTQNLLPAYHIAPFTYLPHSPSYLPTQAPFTCLPHGPFTSYLPHRIFYLSTTQPPLPTYYIVPFTYLPKHLFPACHMVPLLLTYQIESFTCLPHSPFLLLTYHCIVPFTSYIPHGPFYFLHIPHSPFHLPYHIVPFTSYIPHGSFCLPTTWPLLPL